VRDHAKGTVITDNDFLGGPGNAILIADTIGTRITENRFQGHEDKLPVMVHHSRHVELKGNHLQDNPAGALGASSTTGLIVESNTINTTDRALTLWSAKETTLSGNQIYNAQTGIRATDSEDLDIKDNHLEAINQTAIRIIDSKRIQVMDNTLLHGSQYGFLFTDSHDIAVLDNTFADAKNALTLQHTKNAFLEDNLIQGPGVTGIHLRDAHDTRLVKNTLRGLEQGLRVDRGGAVTVTGGNAHLNDFGVLIIDNEAGVLIEQAHFKQNRVAITVQRSSGVELDGLLIEDNGFGAWLSKSEHSIMRHTMVLHNQVGLYLKNSTQNLVYDNLFDNSLYPHDENVWLHDSHNNKWHITPVPRTNIIGGYWTAGNHWSDYGGQDLTGNGLGETPHHPRGETKPIETALSMTGIAPPDYDMHPLVKR
jgi:nitrous oxidase accessory protein NosD